jgi:hypothetical protein
VSWYYRCLCESAELNPTPALAALSPAGAQDRARVISLAGSGSWLARAQRPRELPQRSVGAAPRVQFALLEGPASGAC